MAKNRYKQFVRTVINNFEILEELGTTGDTPQARYGRREFKVKHVVTGEVMVKRMSALRSCKGLMLTEHPRFVDRTGEQVGDWLITGLHEDFRIERNRGLNSAHWTLRNLVTGKTKVSTYKMINYRPRHGYRSAFCEEDKSLYSLWQSLRQACTPTPSKHRQWRHWGARGYTIDRDRWHDFIHFKKDIENEIGPRPTYKAARFFALMPKRGKHLCPGNVQWVELRSHQHPNTNLDNHLRVLPPPVQK